MTFGSAGRRRTRATAGNSGASYGDGLGKMDESSGEKLFAAHCCRLLRKAPRKVPWRVCMRACMYVCMYSIVYIHSVGYIRTYIVYIHACIHTLHKLTYMHTSTPYVLLRIYTL